MFEKQNSFKMSFRASDDSSIDNVINKIIVVALDKSSKTKLLNQKSMYISQGWRYKLCNVKYTTMSLMVVALLFSILDTARARLELSNKETTNQNHDHKKHSFDKFIFVNEHLLSLPIKKLIEHGYHNNDEIFELFKGFAMKHPDLVKPWVYGESESNKNHIYGLRISSPTKGRQLTNPTQSQIDDTSNVKPVILILGGIHGDHALGHELSLYFATLLIENYESSSRVRNLIDNFDIIIIPTLNPDGFAIAREGDCYSSSSQTGRNNLANIDLDTDFNFQGLSTLEDILEISTTSKQRNESLAREGNNNDNLFSYSEHRIIQSESQVILDLAKNFANRLHLVLTLRTGHTGITYPYDKQRVTIPEDGSFNLIDWFSSSLTQKNSKINSDGNAAPDKDLFQYMGDNIYYELYKEIPARAAKKDISETNGSQSECSLTGDDDRTKVVDGSLYNHADGTLTDFLYTYTNAMPMNIYLDCCKYPSKSELADKWLQHANAMYGLLEASKIGIRGQVLDASSGKPIANATIKVTGISKSTKTNEDGFFWRLLPPGRNFEISAIATGFAASDSVKTRTNGYNMPTGKANTEFVQFKLSPLAKDGSSKQVLGSSSAITTSGDIITNEVVNMDGMVTDSQAPNAIELDKKDKVFSPGSVQKFNKPIIFTKPNALFENAEKQMKSLEFSTPTELHKHHNYSQMTQILRNLTYRYPQITKLYSIGQSVQGRELWVLEISNKPGSHQFMKPEFRYVANMHGNEVVGREMLLHLAKLLLENYDKSSWVRAIVESTRIHLMPSLNPDGYEVGREGDCEGEHGRPNHNLVDLNRNFPELRHPEFAENKPLQAETIRFMQWSLQYPFVLDANLHGGSLVANYPFDGNSIQADGKYEKSPDDALFRHLAMTYSKAHTDMSKGQHCPDICGENQESLLNEKFPNGITNGASWYVLYGGIQDWVYMSTSCLTVTLELGCRKYPLAKNMPKYWRDNKYALLKYLLEVHRGIYGSVFDQDGKPIANATISIKDLDHDVYSWETGDFWRILLPGEYQVSVFKENYRAAHRHVTVGGFGSPAVKMTFTLSNGSKGLSLDHLPDDLINPIVADIVVGHSAKTKSIVRKLPQENDGKNNRDIDKAIELESIQHNTEKKVTNLKDMLYQNHTHGDGGHEAVIADGTAMLMSGDDGDQSDSRFMWALCFIVVMPSVLVLVYMVGLFDSKRFHPNKMGFSRLSANDDDDDDDDYDHDGLEPNKRRKNRRSILSNNNHSSVANGDEDTDSSEEDELFVRS